MKYKYTLTESYSYKSDRLKGITYIGEWGNVIDGVITIYSGYAWDGNSFKILRICNLYIGTPDGGFKNGRWEKDLTKYCSLVHDFCYQFNKEITGMTKEIADMLFYDRMKEEKFKRADLYLMAVELLGKKAYEN